MLRFRQPTEFNSSGKQISCYILFSSLLQEFKHVNTSIKSNVTVETEIFPLHCNKNNPIYVFRFCELRHFSPNFNIHVSVGNLYIPRIGPHISCSRMGRSIVGIYNSLTDKWMWKLALWPRNSFSGNICFNFSVLVLCSVYIIDKWAANYKVLHCASAVSWRAGLKNDSPFIVYAFLAASRGKLSGRLSFLSPLPPVEHMLPELDGS